jgi:hypothetical protein
MKSVLFKFITLLVVTSLLLSACGCISAPGGKKCQEGICVGVELVEPIRMNEPVGVVITVEAGEDIPGMIITLSFSDPDIMIEEEGVWTVDVKPNTPVQVSTKVRFPREGYYDVIARAADTRVGLVSQNHVNVRITSLGGTVNPLPEVGPGTPALVQQTPPFPTSMPQPTPTPRLIWLTVTESWSSYPR